MRRFFIDKEAVSSTQPTLTGPDVRHIRTVLRLKPGDEIFLFDGKGSEYRARIADSTSRAIRLLILDQYSAISESCLEIEIGQSLLKARNMDRIVRQLTELGVVAFLPFMSERSVPRPEPSRLGGRKQRWKT
ncbi:MAG: 16S rRNA (uracil(1498)-N(3))-methyltransferase, partial [Desulfobacteraceae bacterium]|nr:16S rRNA (uracil(1498)-N(3))-methyltransferase [Desulfobacteraceae bacterium]